MKHLIYSISVFFLIITGCSTISQKQSDEAANYNNKIVSFTRPVINDFNSLNRMLNDVTKKSVQGYLSSDDVENMSNEFKKLNTLIENNIDSLNKIKEYDKEIKFKDASMTYLLTCKKTLNNDYFKFLANIQKEMTQENLFQSGKLILTILETLLDAEKKAKAVQKKFADKYKFNIAPDNQNWEMIEKQIESYKQQLNQME